MMSIPNLDPSVLILAGMHRSGTSYVASLLQQAGIDMGEHLLGANDSNPKGHFEDLDFLNFHENVLYSQGLSPEGWVLERNVEVPEAYLADAKQLIEARSLKSLWGWKDPRTTLFLDFWAELLPKAQFLLVYRLPWEVIDSIYRRVDQAFQKNPLFALQIWMNYNQAVLDFCDRHSERCLLSSIYNISQHPNYLLEILNNQLNTSLKVVDNLFDKDSLQRISSDSYRISLFRHYFPEAIELFNELESRSKRFDPYNTPVLSDNSKSYTDLTPWLLQDWHDLCGMQKELKTIRSQLEQTQGELTDTRSQLEQTQGELTDTRSQLEQTQGELTDTRSQLEQTQGELTDTRSQLEQTQGELGQARDEYKSLENQVNESHVYLSGIQKEWEVTQRQLQKAQQEWGRLQVVLDEICKLRLSEQEISQQTIKQISERYQVTQDQLQHQLQQAQEVLQQKQERILAMETSKFWKIRLFWFSIKNKVGIKEE
jgi:predicted nuclease with TOPRIM domain